MNIKLDLRSLLLGFACATGVFLLLGNRSGSQDHLKCESISVVDGNGNTVAVLGVTENGTGMMELKTSNGTSQLIARDGAVASFNSNGKRTTYFGTTADGDGIMKTYDSNGKTTTYLGTVSESAKGTRGSLKLYHGNEKLATRINDGFIQTFTKSELVTNYLGTSDDGTGIVKVFGPNGNKVGYFGTSAEGNGILHLYDGEGKLRYMR